jgi:hypothetical protein
MSEIDPGRGLNRSRGGYILCGGDHGTCNASQRGQGWPSGKLELDDGPGPGIERNYPARGGHTGGHEMSLSSSPAGIRGCHQIEEICC